MCKLFFSLNDEHISEHIKEFLAQSICTASKTCKESPDGFGIAWVNPSTNQFELYKQPFSYDKDPNIDSVVDILPQKMVIAHIREKVYGNESYENTHPFLYDNQIFMHNGRIFDFEKHAKLMRSYIAPKFIKQISGETDSELLFFLLISFSHYCKHKALYKSRATRKKSTPTKILSKKQIQLYDTIPQSQQNCPINMMFQFFAMQSITLIANIIYSTPDETWIIKYASPGEECKPLFLNGCKSKGMLITSKVLRDYHSIVIPENSIIKIDYKDSVVRVNPIII
jgi:predicted glutamine amidotransferase